MCFFFNKIFVSNWNFLFFLPSDASLTFHSPLPLPRLYIPHNKHTLLHGQLRSFSLYYAKRNVCNSNPNLKRIQRQVGNNLSFKKVSQQRGAGVGVGETFLGESWIERFVEIPTTCQRWLLGYLSLDDMPWIARLGPIPILLSVHVDNSHLTSQPDRFQPTLQPNIDRWWKNRKYGLALLYNRHDTAA